MYCSTVILVRRARNLWIPAPPLFEDKILDSYQTPKAEGAWVRASCLNMRVNIHFRKY